MPHEIDALTRLVAIADVRALKARYCRLADTQDWEGFRELFTDDCIFDTGTTSIPAFDGGVGPNAPEGAGFVTDSADEFIDTLKVRLRGARSVHQIHEPEIEVTSRTTASAAWPIYDLVLRPEGQQIPSWLGHGYYNETYRKADGRWKISSVKVVRLRMDIVPTVAVAAL